jgi:hypothetical protein
MAEKDDQLKQMQDQIRNYEIAAQNSDKSIRAEFLKMELQHKQKM